MNRSFLLLVAFLLFSMTLSWSQQTLSISATLLPTFSHTYYTNRYLYPESDGQIVEPVYLSGSRWATGYSAGVSVAYNYTPGWSVSSGVWFQQLSLRQARQPIAGPGTVVLHNRVIRFPLLLNYYSSAQRLSPYFSLGLFVDLPITSRVVVTRTGESTQYLRLLSTPRPIFHGLLGAGARYKLTNRYTLMAQPVWIYKFGQLGGATTYDSSFELSLLTQLAYTF
ncbi:PorT family protein [Spirosoma sp. HMF4905]|uniref:PorT family protein n=1 Tax=Spirosoma arboris TaxID=2682092 RepID=A0A7K1SG49_9BACT|nr:PorT family protein [Spirosoma arboris]MVM32782.1 PorT family protein [Spirosoma arboris]